MRIQLPTNDELLQEYKYISKSKVSSISGAIEFNSGTIGPTVGITLCTHGNEPAGLITLWYLRNVFKLQNKLRKGRIIFVLNNLNACEKYLHTISDEEKNMCRFLDVNMNRLPENLLTLEKSSKYEIIRAKELYPIWSQFDVGLDIHSTPQESQPMIILQGEQLPKDLIKGFSINKIISNIDNVQTGKPAFSFYGGGKKIPIIEIESGSHKSIHSPVCAIQCALSLLHNLHIIDQNDYQLKNIHQKYETYPIKGSIIFPNISYTLTRNFYDFEYLKQGEIIAQGDGDDILMPFNGHAIIVMLKAGEKPKKITDEVMYLSEKISKFDFLGF
jgi:hypothetical protein